MPADATIPFAAPATDAGVLAASLVAAKAKYSDALGATNADYSVWYQAVVKTREAFERVFTQAHRRAVHLSRDYMASPTPRPEVAGTPLGALTEALGRVTGRVYRPWELATDPRTAD